MVLEGSARESRSLPRLVKPHTLTSGHKTQKPVHVSRYQSIASN